MPWYETFSYSEKPGQINDQIRVTLEPQREKWYDGTNTFLNIQLDLTWEKKKSVFFSFLFMLNHIVVFTFHL